MSDVVRLVVDTSLKVEVSSNIVVAIGPIVVVVISVAAFLIMRIRLCAHKNGYSSQPHGSPAFVMGLLRSTIELLSSAQ